MKATTTVCPPLAAFYVCAYVIGVGWRKLVRCLCHCCWWRKLVRCLCHSCWVEEACEILMSLVLVEKACEICN